MQRRVFIAAMSATLALSGAAAQEPGNLDWSFRVEPVKSPGPQRVYRIHLNTVIGDGYIIYGSDFIAEIGPRPTRLRLDAADTVKPEGPLLSVGTQRRTDKVLNVEYTYFDDKAELVQTVVVEPGVSRLTGTIRGQTCYETDGTCALFNQRFDIELK